MSEQSTELIVQQKIQQAERRIMSPYSQRDVAVRWGRFRHFMSNQMTKDIDYGVIPGTGGKPTLLQPGAAKILAFYGLEPRPVLEKSIEQWDPENPMFYYLFRYEVWRGDQLVGWAYGSANSRESRYAHRWVSEHELPPMSEEEFNRLKTRGGKTSEYTFAVDKAETEGQYSKPQEYWDAFRKAIEDGTAVSITKIDRRKVSRDAWEIDMKAYRVPNPDIFDQVNTLLKIAEKRAKVNCALTIGLAHEFFTQDLEDMETPPTRDYEEGSFTSIEDTYDADLTKPTAGPALATDQQFAIIGDLLVEAGVLAEATPEAVRYAIRRQGHDPQNLPQANADTIIEKLRVAVSHKAPEAQEPLETEEPAEEPKGEHWAVEAGSMFLDWAKLEHNCTEDQVLAHLNQAEGIKIEKLTDTKFTLEMAQRAVETATAKEQEDPGILF